MTFQVNTKRSLRQNYTRLRGIRPGYLVELVCATMLIGAGLMSADDPIEKSTTYYTTLGHKGCLDCPLVEKCTACTMCY